MSFDVIVHGMPRAVSDAEVAGAMVAWCGPEIAQADGRHVRLKGTSQTDDPWQCGARVVEVYRAAPTEVWLTLRVSDDCLKAICRGFALYAVRRFTGGAGWVAFSTRPDDRLED